MGNMIGSAEAAELLGVSRATLLRWAGDDAPPGLKLEGQKLPGETGAYIFDRDVVLARKAELEAAAETAAVGG